MDRLRRKRWLLPAVLLLEAALLLFGFLQDRKLDAATILLSDSFTGSVEGVTADYDGLYLPAGSGQESAVSRWLTLSPGIYNVTVAYEGSGSVCFSHRVNYIKDGTIPLPQGESAVTFQAYIPARQSVAKLLLSAGGEGLTVRSAVLEPSMAWAWYHLLCRGVFVLLATLLVFLWQGWLVLPGGARQTTLLLGVAGIAVLASVPLFTNQLPLGHDLMFHLNRIEGIKEGLLDGQFPVRIQPFWLRGRGYATGVFYGDILLYFPAVLRFFGVSVQGAYKCYVFAVNLATAAITCRCVRRMTGETWLGLMGSGLYTLAGYRLVSIYTRAAVGEYSAMTFLPLIAYGLWRIFSQRDGEPARPWVWVPAAAGYAGLILTHMLSCEMAGLLTLLVCVVMLRRTLRKNTFWPLCKVVGAAALACLWFLVPFFDFMRGSYRVMSNPPAYSIQISAAFWTQILGLFTDGSVTKFGLDASAGAGGEMSYTVGLSLLAGAALFVLCTVWNADRRRSAWKLGNLCLWTGALCLWMATNTFPWDSLCARFPLADRLANMLQYVWRFLSPASLLLMLCSCCALHLLEDRPALRRTAAAVLAVLCLVGWGSLVQSTIAETNPSACYSAASLNSCRIQNAEYLPTGAAEEALSGPRQVTTDSTVTLTGSPVLDRLHVTVPCASDAGGGVTVPLVSYPYYEARDNATGQMLTVTRDETTWEVRVLVPAGYAGSFTVGFREPPAWRLAELASLAGVLALAGLRALQRRRAPRREAVTV